MEDLTTFESPFIHRGHTVNSIKEVPFIAQLKVNGEFRCGGTILNTLLVLTAAHCIYDKNTGTYFNNWDAMTITVGELQRYYYGPTSQTRKVVSRFGPDAPYNHNTKANDLVILEVNPPFVFNANVKAVYFSNEAIMVGKAYADIYGWGLTEKDVLANRLLTATIPIQSTTTCSSQWPNFADSFPSLMLCGRGVKSEASCPGDSGSPLICRSPTPRLCGLTSFGDKAGEGEECSGTKRSVVYVNVVSYFDWIKRILDRHTPKSKCAANEIQCKNGKCLPTSWWCDKTNDCGDGSDEINCSTKPSINSGGTASSQQTSFRCHEKQIPRSRVCDGIIDCLNATDEVGCNNACSSQQLLCYNKCFNANEFCYLKKYDPDIDPDSNSIFGSCETESISTKISKIQDHETKTITTTFRKCERQDTCERGYRCVKCYVKVTCGGNGKNCKASLDICDLKRRL